jgi:hypothetical protein
MRWMQIRILLAQGRESLKGPNFSPIYFTRTYLNGWDRKERFAGLGPPRVKAINEVSR